MFEEPPAFLGAEHSKQWLARRPALGADVVGAFDDSKAVGGIGAALFKGVGEMARTEKPGKNA